MYYHPDTVLPRNLKYVPGQRVRVNERAASMVPDYHNSLCRDTVRQLAQNFLLGQIARAEIL